MSQLKVANFAVFKHADVQRYLSKPEQTLLEELLKQVQAGRHEDGKPPLECLVLEMDSQEYAAAQAALAALGATPA